MLSILTTVALFLLIIGVVVLVHELGHFLAAKRVGMKVEEFAIGWGPKLWSFKRGETEYMIKLFPIGGYVKILGEEERVKDKESFSEKSVGARMFVASAGVMMNFLLAVILFFVVLFVRNFEYTGIPYYEDFTLVFGQQEEVYAYPVSVLEITEDMPADEAGLEAPFEIHSINGVDIESFDEVRGEVEGNSGGEVELEIRSVNEKGEAVGDVKTVTVGVDEEGMMGVVLAPELKVWKIWYEGWQKPFAGLLHAVNMTKANVFILWKLIGQSVDEGSVAPVAQSVAGPIGLFAIVDIVKEFGGVVGLIDLVALFCLALVLMNMLPFPALDGGHVALLGIEAVRGKPVNDKVQQVMIGVGMALIILLLVLVSAKDFVQFGAWDWLKDLFS